MTWPAGFQTIRTGATRWAAGAAAAVALAAGTSPLLAQAQPPALPPAVPVNEQQAQGGERFLRFVRLPDGGGLLQTSIVRYTRNDGATVDLIGAVHVGDRAYYDLLNERFAGYDALLYEMVKPRDMDGLDRAEGEGGMSWIGMIQKAMQQVLNLEYQLEGINYGRDNFVHADLDLETFMQMQSERGESLLNIMVRQMLEDMTKPPDPNAPEPVNMGEILMALQAPDRARQLKLLMARELSRMEDLSKVLEGPDGSVILTERNKKAVEVIDERLRAGDKELGLFYGAAHMPGIEDLLTERGFKQAGEPEFLTAWDMTLDGRAQEAMRKQTRQMIQEAGEPADTQVLREEIRALREEARALRDQVDNLRRQNSDLARRNEELARQGRQAPPAR